VTTSPARIRIGTKADVTGLVVVQAETWRFAYRGIIPGTALEQYLSRRGSDWWVAWMRRRPASVLVLEFDGALAGYARLGGRPPFVEMAQIFELYLGPAYHGAGLGRRLFQAALKTASKDGRYTTIVTALTDNQAADRFYQAMGGMPGTAPDANFCGHSLPMTSYVWRASRPPSRSVFDMLNRPRS